MSGVKIKYGDFAIGAKEAFDVNADIMNFSKTELLKSDNVNFPKYANPCHQYQTMLDGTYISLDNNNPTVALWSKQMSNEAGAFNIPVSLTLSADKYFTSSGISIGFDNNNNIYPINLTIQWYRDEELLSEKDFNPDNSYYFFANAINSYNKIVIVFKTINMPYNRLKIQKIDFGIGTEFLGNQLKTVNIIQEVDPLSAEISINTCDFTLYDVSGVNHTFQEKQPVEAFFGDTLKSVTYVTSAKRLSKNLWKIESEDAIGLLETIIFKGGIYENKKAIELLQEISSLSGISFEIDEKINNLVVTGHIPYSNCREALMQIAFAIGAVVDTSNSANIKVYQLNTEVLQTVTAERILQGQNFESEAKVTGIEVVSHSYEPSNETEQLYASKDEDTNSEIFVKFENPVYEISITNGNIVEKHSNYAIIRASQNCILAGKKYNHIKTVHRKNIPFIDTTENIVAVENATLVSKHNIDTVLNRCYNYFTKTNSINLNIVEGKHETPQGFIYDKKTNVGDVIEVETEYIGNRKGIIIKQSFNLNGGIIVKNTDMHEI